MKPSFLIRYLVLLTLALMSYASSLTANEHFSPERNWRTIEGQFSIINYPQAMEPIAKKALNSADHILPQLSNYLAWHLEDKVQLVLSDQHDFANGYATPIPYNRSVLFVTLPSGLSELQDYDDWLDLLILHELTHIVHLDKSRDWAYLPRYVFGRNLFSFPNLFQPNFLKEGLATYIETSWQKGVGRGQNAYYDMIMRNEVASGLLPLGKVQQHTRDWPLNKDYSYGVYFYQFLDDKYGVQGITKYVYTTSGQLIPFVVDRPVRHATSINGLDALWAEYLSWLSQRFEKQIESLRDNQTSYELITNTGYANASPYVRADGTVFYIAFDPFGPAYITSINTSSSTSKLQRASTTSKIIYADDDKLLYLQPAPCTHNTQSFALFQYNFADDNRDLIKRCTHYVDATYSSDEIIAVKVEGAEKTLIRYDITNDIESILLNGDTQTNYASPVLTSSDSLFLTRKQAGKEWEIVELNLQTLKVKNLLKQPDINFYEVSSGPSPDKLIVSSDKDRKVELWEYSLSTRALTPLTSSFGGAAYGQYNAATKEIIYRIYTNNGWDIARAEYKPRPNPAQAISKPERSAFKLDKPGRGFELDEAEKVISSTTPMIEEKYSAIDTVAPSSWFFSYISDNAQSTASVLIDGRDALNFHNWGLVAGRDFENDLDVLQARYTAYNHLTLLYSRDYDYTIGNSGVPSQFVDKAVRIEEDEDIAVIGHINWYFDLYPLTFAMGWNHENTQQNDLINNTSVERSVNTTGLGLYFNSAQTALYGISPSHGRSIQFNLEHDEIELSASGFNAKSNGEAWTLDWREYIGLYEAHTLVLRALVGKASQGADFYDLTDSPDFSVFKQPFIHKRAYPLRGYPDSSPELRGYKPTIYSADYRFPIAYIDEGLAAWPIGLHSVSGALFYESGKADSGQSSFDAAGLELNIGLDLGYSALPVAIRGGVAFPFESTLGAPEKDPNYYLGIGYSL